VRRIAELIGGELKWVQPTAFKPQYELRAGDELVAHLRISGLFRDQAAAESADGCWMFERVGFWRNKVRVRAGGAQSAAAVFKLSRWGDGSGVLQLRDGRKLPATTNFWRTEYQFRSEAGELLLRLSSAGVLRQNAKVEVHARAAGLPELPWLMMLGMFLMVAARADAASGTG
jgi:hypothetical protein